MRLLVVAIAVISQSGSPIFRFEADGFWLNLHHYLYVLGRAEAKVADSRREAVAGAPADQAEGLKSLSEAEQQAWREAVSFYAGTWSRKDTVFDADLVTLSNQMRGAADDRPTAPVKIDPGLAAVLDRAAPIYRKAWWPRHRDSNRAWTHSMQDPLTRHGPEVLAYLTGAYQQPWEVGGYPVNVAAFSNWAGAYSTSSNLLVVSSMNPGNQGLHGFEITFHEAMHQWDEEIDARLRQLSSTRGLKFNDLLSHAMIFYTTGEAVRRVVPGHTPYAELAGIWKGRMGMFKPALDAHWKPYLDGKSTLDEALVGLLKS